jgi:phosphoglycerate dehydrogenase-like enzyme
MTLPLVAVVFEPEEDAVRNAFVDALGTRSELVFLTELDEASREDALTRAKVLLVFGSAADMSSLDPALFGGKLVQTMIAGVDQFPFAQLPTDATIAHNGGAFAPQMAEHIVGMVLAVKKEFLWWHTAMQGGVWRQLERTREVKGDTCLIVGFGGIGKATADLLRPFGVRIEALNRSGKTDAAADFVGTLDDLPAALRRADIVVLSCGLNARTRGLIDKVALNHMKSDAILVNVARGAVIEQADLFGHLQATPSFSACLDTWWGEPYRDGKFVTDYPFVDLPNVLGSPHNSGITVRYFVDAARHAAANVQRFLDTGTAGRLVTAADHP